MLIRINGRLKFFQSDITLKQERRGLYTGTCRGYRFTIEGGKHAGGSRTDWFVECPDFWNGSIQCKSLVDSLRTLDNA